MSSQLIYGPAWVGKRAVVVPGYPLEPLPNGYRNSVPASTIMAEFNLKPREVMVLGASQNAALAVARKLQLPVYTADDYRAAVTR
jgi:hypothetical protein